MLWTASFLELNGRNNNPGSVSSRLCFWGGGTPMCLQFELCSFLWKGAGKYREQNLMLGLRELLPSWNESWSILIYLRCFLDLERIVTSTGQSFRRNTGSFSLYCPNLGGLEKAGPHLPSFFLPPRLTGSVSVLALQVAFLWLPCSHLYAWKRCIIHTSVCIMGEQEGRACPMPQVRKGPQSSSLVIPTWKVGGVLLVSC